MEMAVLGTSEFILGFQLAGIRLVQEAAKEPTRQLSDLMENPDVGIIIVDDETLRQVSEHERYRAERSPKPIVITLSKKTGGQDDLRKMIKQAIGVDILKDEE
ncbi:MAG: V-type ATP synthase subunit F [DPANN group archaeon]|nr:V-type ATP synthase subunit F [DPANN group archaeon]